MRDAELSEAEGVSKLVLRVSGVRVTESARFVEFSGFERD